MFETSPQQPLVLVDCRPETEEVLKAVFEPRGVVVSRLRFADLPACDPQLVVRTEPGTHSGTYAEIREGRIEVQLGHSRQAVCRELRLPGLFHYGDLIRAVERVLAERHVA